MSVKAFELVPAVERELLMGDKARINIECIECCGKHLYVGTNDCFIHHFLLEEHATAKGMLSYSVQKLLFKYLGLKKPVEALKAASALERIIVLCDATVSVVDMITLEPVPLGGAKIKGVAAFCVNENPVNGDPFCVEIGVISARRRTVQIYMVYEDRVQLVKEVNTPEQPCAVSLDGYFLCLALSTQYMILNYSTGAAQDLFPYDSEERKPIVKRIGREEFLLAAPGGLGMFANAEGVSQRAPVNWSESVMGAAVCFPYVVALDEGFVTVHSMLDQQLKQTLSFRDGHILQDFEAGHRVEEALTLTEGARRNIPKDKFQILHKRILQQAGFIQFGQLQFLEAKEHFRTGQLDIRELISLYPLLLPASSSFTRCHPPLHEYFALGLLYHYNGQDSAALQLWVRVVNGDLQDSTRSDLYEYIIGVQVFTKRPLGLGKDQVKEQKGQVNPDDVITYLGKHSQALLLYLEYLIQECDQLLLERATLHGKLEEHDKALHILVHQLKDFPAAEAYCVWGSASRDPAYQQRLFHLLLGVYLDRDLPSRNRAGNGGSTGELEMAAVDLLNRHGEVFDAVRVLDLLPEGWSLQLLRPFLGRALRGSMHACRTSQVALGLARSENLQLQHDRLKQRRSPVLVSEKKGCVLCHNTFSEPDCVCLPGGVPVHTHCAAQRVVRDSPTKRQLANSSNHT
ncbi:unnamed protein product [Coregonus sp. 'balchen']|nr:unnamed protein product [Coregonus sp. 'balchen']